MNVYPVVMAGGSGTRFWPASRRAYPKQLLPLYDGQSMFRSTIDRLLNLYPPDQIRVISPSRLQESLRKEAPELPEGVFLQEPSPRDTAPCIGLAAREIRDSDPEAAMLVLPCDHFIPEEAPYTRALNHAVQVLHKTPESLITFGVTPDAPRTGFGYIQKGDLRYEENGTDVYAVDTFTEKPDRKTAEEYLRSDNYVWNAGMFLWRAEEILEQLKKHAPDVYQGLDEYGQLREETDDTDRLREVFERIPARSIDYAVMEQAGSVLVVEAEFEWLDLGTWNALPELLSSDEENFVKGIHHLKDVKDCVVYNERSDHLVAGLDLDGLIVVHTEDATLVCSMDRAQDIKQLVAELEEEGWEEYL